MEILKEAAEEENETQIVEQNVSFEVPFVASGPTRTLTPATNSVGEDDDPMTTATQAQAETEPCLNDELLERVFG